MAMLLLLSGCRSVPFERVESVDMRDADAAAIRAAFASRSPPRYELLNSVVFEVMGREMSALGWLTVDAPGRQFALVCMTPLGLKVLDISGDRDSTRANFAVPGSDRQGEFAAAIGRDVRDVYIDLVPAGSARATKHRNDIVFEEEVGDRRIVHVFGGQEGLLLEKRVYRGRRLSCRIGYYEYKEHAGRAIPMGIVVRNPRRHYRLTVRVKEVRSVSDGGGSEVHNALR